MLVVTGFPAILRIAYGRASARDMGSAASTLYGRVADGWCAPVRVSHVPKAALGQTWSVWLGASGSLEPYLSTGKSLPSGGAGTGSRSGAHDVGSGSPRGPWVNQVPVWSSLGRLSNTMSKSCVPESLWRHACVPE